MYPGMMITVRMYMKNLLILNDAVRRHYSRELIQEIRQKENEAKHECPGTHMLFVFLADRCKKARGFDVFFSFKEKLPGKRSISKIEIYKTKSMNKQEIETNKDRKQHDRPESSVCQIFNIIISVIQEVKQRKDQSEYPRAYKASLYSLPAKITI